MVVDISITSPSNWRESEKLFIRLLSMSYVHVLTSHSSQSQTFISLPSPYSLVTTLNFALDPNSQVSMEIL